MGIRRLDFRPDKMVSMPKTIFTYSSEQNQCVKRTHNRRQRWFNRKISNFMDDGE